jgi:LysM repeat protein
VSNLPIDPADPNNVRVVIQGTNIGVDQPLVWTLTAVPQPTTGIGWERKQRPGRRELVYWAGAPAWTYSFPIILHAGPTDARIPYLRRQKQAIDSLMFSPAGGGEPRLATLTGVLVPRPLAGKNWAMTAEPSVEAEEHTDDGDLRFYSATLTLTKLTESNPLEISGVPSQTHRTHTLKKGETLAQVAAANDCKVSDLRLAGGGKVGDPQKLYAKVNRGETVVLWLPGVRGGNAVPVK